MKLEVFRDDKVELLKSFHISSIFEIENSNLQLFTMVKGNISSIAITDEGEGDSNFIFYLLSGKIEFDFPQKSVILETHDSLKVLDGENYNINAIEDSQVLLFSLCAVNVPKNQDEEVNQLECLVSQVTGKDIYTASHCYQVTVIAEKLFLAIMPNKDTYEIGIAAHFHDIGKIEIPDEIINKPGKLTVEEFKEIKKHPVVSYNMLLEPYGKSIATMARHHHEKLDGSGYPDHLNGDEITTEERILGVADVFDALTNNRSYRHGFTVEKAIQIMKTEEKHHLDQNIVKVLEKLLKTGVIAID